MIIENIYDGKKSNNKINKRKYRKHSMSPFCGLAPNVEKNIEMFNKANTTGSVPTSSAGMNGNSGGEGMGESYKPTYTYSYIGPVYRFEKLYDTLKEPVYTTAQNRKHASTMLKGKLKQKYGFAPSAKLDIEEKQIREISPLEYEDEMDYYNYWDNKNKEDIEDAELVSYINGDKIYYKDGYYKIAGNNMTFVSEEEAREFLEDR